MASESEDSTSDSSEFEESDPDLVETRQDSEETPMLEPPESSNLDQENTAADITDIAEQNALDNQQILSMLGNDPGKQIKFGPNIHEELGVRWTSYLREGFVAERRKELVIQHLVPDNCRALNPPQLNEEIKSLLPLFALKNDHYLCGLQEQLGAGLTILGSILSKKLEEPDKDLVLTNDKFEKLVEAGQLFTNIHQGISLKRRFEINPHLNPDCRSAAIKTSLDDYLFGSEFLTKVKANREVKKAAAEIKKPSVIKYSSPAGPSGTQNLNSKRQFYKPRIKEDKRERRQKGQVSKQQQQQQQHYRKKPGERSRYPSGPYRR